MLERKLTLLINKQTIIMIRGIFAANVAKHTEEKPQIWESTGLRLSIQPKID